MNLAKDATRYLYRKRYTVADLEAILQDCEDEDQADAEARDDASEFRKMMPRGFRKDTWKHVAESARKYSPFLVR